MNEQQAILEQGVMDEDSLYAGVQALRAVSLDATVPRLAIWHVIAQSDRPLGAVEIKRRLIRRSFHIAISTIYTVLRRMQDVSLISTCTIAGKSHYYLSSRHFHHRFVCTESGQEYWLEDVEIAQAITALCQKHGFQLADYTLSVKGKLLPDSGLAVPTV